MSSQSLKNAPAVEIESASKLMWFSLNYQINYRGDVSRPFGSRFFVSQFAREVHFVSVTSASC